MLISVLRDDTEWNCKASRRPAFRDDPTFSIGDITLGIW